MQNRALQVIKKNTKMFRCSVKMNNNTYIHIYTYIHILLEHLIIFVLYGYNIGNTCINVQYDKISVHLWPL